MKRGRGALLAFVSSLALSCGSKGDEAPAAPGGLSADVIARLKALSPPELPHPPTDATNRWADDPAAAALGKKFFFETRFSGQLLDESNQGPLLGALGNVGDTGKVSC